MSWVRADGLSKIVPRAEAPGPPPQFWISEMACELYNDAGQVTRQIYEDDAFWARGRLTRLFGGGIMGQEVWVGTQTQILASAITKLDGSFEAHFRGYDLGPGKYRLSVLFPGFPLQQPAMTVIRQLATVKSGIDWVLAGPYAARKGETVHWSASISNWDTFWSQRLRFSVYTVAKETPMLVFQDDRRLDPGSSQVYKDYTFSMLDEPIEVRFVLERHTSLEGWQQEDTKSVMIAYTEELPGPDDPPLYIMPSGKNFEVEILEAVAPPPVGQGQVAITSTPSGATITMEGVSFPLGVTPMTVDTTPGLKRFTATLKGYKTSTQTVTVVEGGKSKVHFALKPAGLPKEEKDLTTLAVVGGVIAAGIGIVALLRRRR